MPDTHREQPDRRPSNGCVPVVGIGASAGGLDALRALFMAMPADAGIGFVVTQHLDATHQSLLADLLTKYTAMPVTEAQSGMGVERDHVYVIPPNAYLTINGGILHLERPTDPRGMRMPIDRFLFSLAKDQQNRAIAIILSGSGTDGTLGIREIRANGGLIMVQDPDAAQYDGMPRSAIATGQADAVLPLERMPEVLIGYLRHHYVRQEDQAKPGLEAAPGPLSAILTLLLTKTGHDFRCYKKGTLVRRIHRRMGITATERLEDYLELLRKQEDEARVLSRDLFIGVTSFFRETEAWSEIAEQVIAPLLAGHTGDDPIRVWVPGCATGEEVYTLAILFAEAFERSNREINLLIFATDVDGDALQIGREGHYQGNIAENLSQERLSRFFSKEGDGFRVNSSLRDLIVFTRHNLIADPPFSKLDLISCRNLLIYLESSAQEKVRSLFHFALNPGGYLVLGRSESLGAQQAQFRTLSKKWRIFQPEGPSRLPLADMPSGRNPERLVPRLLPRALARHEPSLADMALQALVETFVPASVLVTRRHQVLYVFGDTSDYLTHPPGELTDDLIAMTRSELRFKTRAALHQASAENRQVVQQGIQVKIGETSRSVALTVTPLHQPTHVAGLLLVSFHREPEAAHQPPGRDLGQGAEAQVIGELEAELKTTRDELQRAIEELETSNEELKALNEEVMSMNEELQSSNEELETSKEELQSVNEELTTVNNQLQNKVAEVEGANNDLSNLLSSTNIATLFLDRTLHIKRFTPAITMLMNLIPADAGRQVEDIAVKFANGNLQGDCRKVLEELRPVEREIQAEGGDWYLRRVQPYCTHDNRIDGAVVTFTDVTAMKLRDEEHAQLASIVESSENAIIGMTLDGVITSWSPGAEATCGYRADEMIGETLDCIFPSRGPDDATYILHQIRSGQRVGPYEADGRRKDGSEVQLSVTVSPIRNAAGQAIAASVIARDITEHKRAQQVLMDADRRKDEFLAILGHELRNPLTPIRNAVSVLSGQDDLPEKAHWAAEVIARQSEVLEHLVSDLLEVSRIARGEMQLRIQKVTLQDLLEEARGNVAELVEQHRHALDVSLAEAPVVLMGDPLRLGQVFTNLLSNAVKYTPDGGHIRVSLTQEGQQAVVRVRDDGVGIRAEDIPQIFNLFSRGRGQQGDVSAAGGLGVGLAFARRLVALHDGLLEGYSDGPGKGSEFVVIIPSLQPKPPAGRADAKVKKRAEDKAASHRILVVDDNPEVADSFRVLLEARGHDVRVLNSGSAIVATIGEFRPEVVFLDIGMPDMDGYQVAAAIRAASPGPRPFLVAMTGYGQDRDRKAAMEAGFDQYQLKPLSIRQIETLLAELD